VQPRPIAGKTVNIAGGAAPSVAGSQPVQVPPVDSPAPPAAAASVTVSGRQAASDSYAMPLLALVILALVGFASMRLWRLYQRRRREALWRQQDETWEAALRWIEQGGTPAASKSSAKPLQRINA
jgi:hypothetical protein